MLAAVAVFGFASVASAADMPVKAPVYRAPVATIYNWTGCYVGAHVGGGWARTEFTNTADTTDFGHLDPGEGFTYTHDGFIGGGQVGCRREATPAPMSNFPYLTRVASGAPPWEPEAIRSNWE